MTCKQCPKPVKTRGLCENHYIQLWRRETGRVTGQPKGPKPKPKTIKSKTVMEYEVLTGRTEDESTGCSHVLSLYKGYCPNCLPDQERLEYVIGQILLRAKQ